MKRYGLVLAAAAVACARICGGQEQSAAPKTIRIAVAGDSLCSNGDPAWPTVLGQLLGDRYEVKTFSANGLSVLKNTYRSIWTRYEHVHAAEYKGDITLVCFGANDAKPGNWARKGEWFGLYKRLVGMYKGENRKVYIVLPPPAQTEAPYGISREILHNQTIPALKQIAEETGCGVIDPHTALLGRSDVTVEDGLYPTAVGHRIIAITVFNALTGKNMDLPPPPREKTPAEIAAEEAARAVKADFVLKMNVGDTAVLTAAYVADPKGDGPDGRGNSEDDTWQFWFELAHARGTYHRLSLPTATMPANQREAGITDPGARPGHQKKVTGPIGGTLPNPKDTEGWIYWSDWDGRFEGVWGDKKANQVMAHPYVEKNTHGCVAISFRVPAGGAYDVSGRLTDLAPVNAPALTGILWSIEAVREQTGENSPKAHSVAARGGPIGDGKGPDSQDVTAANLELKKGDMIRLVIDPNNQWGTDLTRVENLTVKRVK